MMMNDVFNAAYFISHISFEILFLHEVGVELTSHYCLSGASEFFANTSGDMPQTCAREVIIADWCTSSTVLTWIGETPICLKKTTSIK